MPVPIHHGRGDQTLPGRRVYPAWKLIDKPRRGRAEDEAMILLPMTSTRNLAQHPDCPRRNRSTGDRQISHELSLARWGEAAQVFGENCLAVSQETGPH